MTSPLNERIFKYISSQGLNDLYPILVYQTKLCESRSMLIEDGSEKFKQYLKVNGSDSIMKLHATQLDIVSKLCMFIEDYLSFSYYLRVSKKELPRKIHSQKSVVWKEIEHLDKLKAEHLQKYLLLPNVKNLPIEDTDKNLVTCVLRMMLTEMHRRIKRIITFYNDYHRVYNKYKHIFTSLIGTFSVEENVRKARIFIRDEFENKKEKVIQKATYVLSSEVETIEYYEMVRDDVLKVFLTLLECHLHSIQNCGKPFLIPGGFFPVGQAKEQWLEIIKKVNFVTGVPTLNLIINVKEEKKRIMLESLSAKHIFVNDKDIMQHPENNLRFDVV